MKKFNLITTGLALTLAASFVTYAVPSNNTQNTSQMNNTSNLSTVKGKQLLTIEQITNIAMKKVPNGFITHLELDREFHRYIYDIELIKDGYEYELKLDAETGKGISIDKDKEHWSKNVNVKNLALPTGANVISAYQAANIALSQTPQGMVVDIELDVRNNTLIYTVDVVSNNIETEIDIDAVNGTVLNLDTDRIND